MFWLMPKVLQPDGSPTEPDCGLTANFAYWDCTIGQETRQYLGSTTFGVGWEGPYWGESDHAVLLRYRYVLNTDSQFTLEVAETVKPPSIRDGRSTD